ncbi:MULTISPECIES: UDP-glucose 4-epimerase GalE [unclassified Pseudomonas]|uniref:UDP-glucose 4-epimerase GalE n=1 Tax=unclassified Pseudomonas TaxID=196821 RepID=UPI0008713C95|nr:MULTISPECIES: UDP-glucose 4-epimerase GalE [unclassified Pseudomonas]SCW62867.1 UDP-galactose 4-epimerase [Pseudomonas sp. NFACC05-1]SFL61058.1 UDP-galactose 4-epimerase [Pseudomonas sp. NFACC46-3]
MRVLVTGGTGYIGSHFVLELLLSGYDVVVLDNLSNSVQAVIERVCLLSGKEPIFIEGDVRDAQLLDQIFSEYAIDKVAHFAGLKAVGQSVCDPILYYDNNVYGSIVLFKAMAKANVFCLVFSSSATVYGDPKENPIIESSFANSPSNPYGRSKLFVENILADVAVSDPRWSIAILRYFNPIGAHESGLIGEAPNGTPNNLLPYLSQVAVGKLSELSVYGDDYLTPDGTGVRDYIHVVDLVRGHLAALVYLDGHVGKHVWNLGTGVGYSVMQVVRAFEKVCGKTIPIKIMPRRLGDIAACWADTTKAEVELSWRAEYGLEKMVEDTWRWQLNSPDGYEG